MNDPLFVVYTNCFISANLIENSISAVCFDRILSIGTIAMSDSIFAEYTEVLYRKKLDKYLANAKRIAALSYLKKNSVFFNIIEKIELCKDPKDNMFLELANACSASCIISGDPHLLILHPFGDIPILNATSFITVF